MIEISLRARALNQDASQIYKMVYQNLRRLGGFECDVEDLGLRIEVVDAGK